MKNSVLTFCILVICITTQMFAQVKVKENNTHFLIRGKVAGMVLIEDLWARSGSLGAEIRFCNYWGVAVDIVHFQWKNEREVPIIPGNYDDYNEYSKRDQRNYVALETRYYPWKYSSENKLKPYLNLFSKYGQRQIRVDDLYPYSNDEEIRLNSSIFDVGFSCGMAFGLKYGIDFNIGIDTRFENKTVYTHVASGLITYGQNLQSMQLMPNCRLMFFYKL